MGTLLGERAFGESDWVTHSNAPRLDDLSQYSLAIVFHQRAQTHADRVHALARRTRLAKQQNRFSDLNRLAGKFDEVDAQSLDVGADGAGRDCLQAKRRGVLGNLFALDQADLPAGGFAGAGFYPPEVTWLAENSFASDNFDGSDLLERLTGFDRM